MSSACTHSSICYTSSPHAKTAGFKRPDTGERLAAAEPTEALLPEEEYTFDNPAMFPPPLVFPGDDLAEDPEYPPQNYRQWFRDEDRNPVTGKRRTVYVVPAPLVGDEVSFMKSWSIPRGVGETPRAHTPKLLDIRDYLAAFYRGLPVKALTQSPLEFMSWEELKKSKKSQRDPQYVGLRIGDECVGIRTRACPDGIYSRQLNLDDLLDAAISMLPKDAYALLLLTEHDLYEDDEDTFVCGRAYGGSRVAVVSNARYNPDLDALQSVDRLHAWPLSHCAEYMSTCCSTSEPKTKRQKKSQSAKANANEEPSGQNEPIPLPLDMAFSVARSLTSLDWTQESLAALWLGRMCRTASHELGHCFGIDHCVYYACCMQGTGSIQEDARQPPYICPVDQAKLLRATGTTEAQRDSALLSFCDRSELRETQFFAPFAAWLRAKSN
ncbi:hypothetical protein BDV35DRAFT_366350 [Aspergillus flavus]|uniref:Peptidase zinc-dependent n=3 Tax=Aspergillus subgen. Circumdati TaxID=2720871 RepID=A0A1S9E1F2_ASPOZ|nr:hypothetical protein BDV35DRAFT_366350 [Aspergillus flavus]OOO15168.1 peptidase zinc-dependent [Aspergillus oryzae]GMG52806.1 unnamed protein product [Aspergillus oryzae var. brunneus]GMF80983.1 unnamed protein product [Aspergillus oryzae]GMF96797.1 unnamed protein product [Aspergillus oryzae]